MSRSRNERSVPQGRGRKGEKKAKRLSHRRARNVTDDTDAKFAYNSETLDRETRQKDIGKL